MTTNNYELHLLDGSSASIQAHDYRAGDELVVFIDQINRALVSYPVDLIKRIDISYPDAPIWDARLRLAAAQEVGNLQAIETELVLGEARLRLAAAQEGAELAAIEAEIVKVSARRPAARTNGRR